jgi:hypothetical protein
MSFSWHLPHTEAQSNVALIADLGNQMAWQFCLDASLSIRNGTTFLNDALTSELQVDHTSKSIQNGRPKPRGFQGKHKLHANINRS